MSDGPQVITQRLLTLLGDDVVTALLGVSTGEPGRWATGGAVPNEENRAKLADLDALAGHLRTAFTPAQARLWLEGHDAHLNGRPIDVFRREGSAAVIEAIRAYEQGAFA